MTVALKCQALTKGYGSFRLEALDLELSTGTVLGYVGPNGSGKTTTMNCIVGLVRPDSGSVEVFGHAAEAQQHQWRQHVGHVGDQPLFYANWSGRQNLEFRARFYPGWNWRYVEDLARRFEVPLNRSVKSLSRGNQIKLSILAALGHEPGLLLLDEPTAGLDPVVRSEVLDALFELVAQGDRAIFYSTHILSDIEQLADELAFLRDGSLLARWSREDLVETWRKLTFHFEGPVDDLAGAVEHRRKGFGHMAVTRDVEATRRHLAQVGASEIEESPMAVGEIAVHILKERGRVALG